MLEIMEKRRMLQQKEASARTIIKSTSDRKRLTVYAANEADAAQCG